MEFEIDRPGVYHASATYRDSPDGQKVGLAVGHGVASSITTTVVMAIAVMFGTVILAALVSILTFVKRRKAKKVLVRGGYPSHPMPFPGN